MSNRYSTFKNLRERWQSHIESTLFRPVLLIDEAQDLHPVVLSELKSLSSVNFDSKSIITVILCGDERLPEKLKSTELKTINSRIRTKLITDLLSPEELSDVLAFIIEKAGNPNLMTKDLINTLADHALGNIRTLMSMSEDLLVMAMRQDIPQLDEKLFLEFYGHAVRTPNSKRRKKK